MPVVFWVAAGGAIGASARYFVMIWSARVFGSEFPWGVFIANVSGSFLMGILIALAAVKFNVGQEARAFLATGILGGYTTFSAFSLDFAVLYERKQILQAALYAAGSVSLSLLAIFCGLWLVRSLAS